MISCNDGLHCRVMSIDGPERVVARGSRMECLLGLSIAMLARRVIVTFMVTTKRPSPPPPTISAAEFKARCLELMDSVARTGSSVVVTKRGKPIATLGPVRPRRRSAYGFLKGRIKILGDIISPIDVKWDADR